MAIYHCSIKVISRGKGKSAVAAAAYRAGEKITNDYEIGVYGRMRERFLEEHHHGTYTSLLLTGKLWKHLADIDTACHERMDFLISAMAKREGVTEDLKAANQMEWVGRMNNIRNRAEEIILHDLVYTL